LSLQSSVTSINGHRAGNGQADLELLNLGNPGGNSEDRNLVPAGLLRNTGSMILYKNMRWDNNNLKWLTPDQDVSAYGSACLEVGGEACILHATPPGVNFSDVPHEILLASAGGTDGETNNRITSGYFTQSKAPIFARFNSTAYNVSSTNNCWNDTTGAHPLLWLSTAEAKGSDNELARLEGNTVAPAFFFARSNGTLGTRTVTSAAGSAGFLGWKHYDGDEFHITSQIDSICDAAPANNDVGSTLQFWTSPSNTASLAVRMSINSAGHVIIASIPTSSAGLATGTLWSDSGTIKIA